MSSINSGSEWWKEAVLYQIYPQSFKDSDKDGIGDWQGIISKLDYLQSLGIDAICFRPFLSQFSQQDSAFEQLVNEANSRGLKVIASRADLPISFQTDHLILRESSNFLNPPPALKLSELKRIFRKREQAKDDWNCVYWGDHDTPRVLSRFGNTSKFENESAKMLGMILLTLKGTPLIYQGDELGMSNCTFNAIEEFRDEKVGEVYESVIKKIGIDEQAFLRVCNQISVDHARTPMPWDNTEMAGFTECTSTWLKINPSNTRINVASQENNTDSILSFYKSLIHIRKGHPDLVYGDYNDLRPNCNKIFAYRRIGKDFTYLVLNNWTNKTQSFSVKCKASVLNLLLSNYPNESQYESHTFELQPYECRIYEYAN